METLYTYYASAVGTLLLAGNGTELTLISFPDGDTARLHDSNWRESAEVFTHVTRQLDAYFNGSLNDFDVPIKPEGTDFQQKVWKALRNIPYGETCSYSDLAKAIDAPYAVRAVGSANNANPIPLIIPCHRVIGKNGQLVGFGGGLAMKETLLRLENAPCVNQPEQQLLF